MKKKILIISIICILCIAIIISYLAIKKIVVKTNVSEAPVQENDLLNDESISNVENINEYLNNIVESEQNIEKTDSEENAQTKDEETTTQSNPTQNKTSSKTTSNKETKKYETKNETVKEKETSIQESPSTQSNIPSTVDEQKQEIIVNETPTRCTNNNNHSMGVGNSGQWFSNKNDAIAYYNSKISYWGNLWETEQIDDSTYYKNCPSGYEIWDCAYCSMWTINFYYR